MSSAKTKIPIFCSRSGMNQSVKILESQCVRFDFDDYHSPCSTAWSPGSQQIVAEKRNNLLERHRPAIKIEQKSGNSYTPQIGYQHCSQPPYMGWTVRLLGQCLKSLPRRFRNVLRKKRNRLLRSHDPQQKRVRRARTSAHYKSIYHYCNRLPYMGWYGWI